MSNSSSQSERTYEVILTREEGSESMQDSLAVEEPMEIRVVLGPNEKRTGKSLSITMRTPGHDFELAAGFLLTEGIITQSDHIQGFEFCGPVAEGRSEGNIVRVELTPEVELDIKKLQRHFYTTSSCGICGKASLEAINAQGLQAIEHDDFAIDDTVIRALPDKLKAQQDVFARTGGLHAAGWFDHNGDLVAIREDVGRHNALDKLIGNRLLNHSLSNAHSVVVVSGRASFELLQKALVARIPMLVAVGAPSSLAVDLAREFNMTLIGFASKKRINVYSGRQRVR